MNESKTIVPDLKQYRTEPQPFTTVLRAGERHWLDTGRKDEAA